MIADLSIWDWRAGTGTAILTLAILSTVTILMDLRLENYDEEYIFQNMAPMYRVTTATAMLVIVIILSASQANAFIYFQF
jgi:hypothetical protein